MKKSKLNRSITRRQVLKAGLFAGAGMLVPWKFNLSKAIADAQIPGLSDPLLQPKFAIDAPNALAPSFKYYPIGFKNGRFLYDVAARQIQHNAGLVGPDGTTPVTTTVWGYAPPLRGATWPGRTFEVKKNQRIAVRWRNKLIESGQPLPHLLPVDTSLHWAYGLHGYTDYSIKNDGVPLVAHLHGGHTQSPFDGNPEYFFSPNFGVRGPRWGNKWYKYDNDQDAGNLWYHDHALGITRLNVWAGLAGFYFIRDNKDTGNHFNPLGLPAYPYELAYAIQDRMFRDNGELFYSAYPGQPFYDDFITSDVKLPPELFDGGGPTALAEFFGDHIVVNGVIWPKTEVEPRNYRMHLLNGTDSRFMVVRFRATTLGATDLNGASDPLPFHVIGSDQGLAGSATYTDTLVFEPGSRYDIVFDFSDQALRGKRVIMENIGGDAPFGGEFGDALDQDDLFKNRQTDRIMAFDVVKRRNRWIPDRFDPSAIHHYGGNNNTVTRTRKVALFEGMDDFGRLQPLLGTAEPATDYAGNPINWPNEPAYVKAGLVGPMEGSVAWHSPTTENPALGSTEIWEIYNATGDAHPVHLHLVNFQVLDRREFVPNVVQQPVVQHNGEIGMGFRLTNATANGPVVDMGVEYVENAPKDMVTALPDQVTRIKMTFDKPGRYVWHCHILSHEDHEMMRVLHVGPGA